MPRTARNGQPPVDPRFEPVARAFAEDPDVAAGTMMASFGLKSRGKIFAMISRGRFVAKLPKDRVDALVRAGTGAPWGPSSGRVMKEWVALAADEASWVALAREAKRFVDG